MTNDAMDNAVWSGFLAGAACSMVGALIGIGIAMHQKAAPQPSLYFLACATPDGALADGIVSVGRPTLADGQWTVYPFGSEGPAVTIELNDLQCAAVGLPAFVKS